MEKIHILLIDRHQEDGDLIRKLLNQQTQIELDLTHVPDFAAGKPVLESGLWDLVLFDLDPKPGGANLEDLIELADVYSRFPIVILIETSDPNICLAAIKNGTQDYVIKKQMNVDALFMAMTFAIERKKRETELLFLANHDPLTGLPNRRLFSDRLERGMKRFYRKTDHLSLGILLLDLDDFKKVNDRYGHQIGDKVLATVGNRLKYRLRKNDTVARLGGDEFVIILEGVISEKIGKMVAQELIRIITQPIEVDDHVIFVTGSLGIAFYPNHGKDVENLLEKADQAMYKAKKLKGKICIYAD